jgi:hypothetical protein
MKRFVEDSKPHAAGWIGFYWGKTIEEYGREKDLTSAVMKAWLEYFRQAASSREKIQK